MVQERPYQRCIEVVDVELVRCLAGALLRETKQQADRVAVGGNGVRAAVTARSAAR
jgi:predicted cupin superfamily sugar epimerase